MRNPSLRSLLLAATLGAALAAGSLAPAGALARAAGGLPPPVERDLPGLKQVGRGELRWLGFGIYDASLWSADGRFDGNESGEPMALSLWYRRGFARDELVSITTGEWNRLALGDPARRERWAGELRAIWRDVRRGDNLTAVVLPAGETRFYDAGRLLGRVADPAFGPAFLAIWLDSRSAVGELRERLLGDAR
jgi:hypothetical protein